MIKTEMMCTKCHWRTIAFFPEDALPTMVMCGGCLAVGLEIMKRFFLDRGNYQIDPDKVNYAKDGLEGAY